MTAPDANNGTNTEQDKDSFSYTVTDANGNTATGTILVDIVDDVPTARADTDSVTEGAAVDGQRADGRTRRAVLGRRTARRRRLAAGGGSSACGRPASTRRRRHGGRRRGQRALRHADR